MGVEKENCVRVTRAAARKRAAEVDSVEVQAVWPAKRKRVILGEIRNFSNATVVNGSGAEKAKPKPRRKQQLHQKEKGGIHVDALPPTARDIDAGVDDPQMCADHHQYLRSKEVEPKRRPLANFIETVQTEVTPNMRAILVDWLVEVAQEYKLKSDTLFLTVSYIDRFLSRQPMDKKRLQLLGVSSMLIASKFEEISPPHAEDFCDITDNTYTKQEVLKVETDILNVLKFEMGNPTTKNFLERYTKAGQDDPNSPSVQLELLSSYLAELSLLDYGCVQFLPSVIAASVVFVARFTLSPQSHPWNSTLQHYCGYKPSELKDCIQAIHDLQMNKKGSNLTAIRDKYKHHKFKCVSSFIAASEIPSSYFEGIQIQRR